VKLAVYQLVRIFSALYVHESLPFVRIPGQINPVHAFPILCLKIRLNIPSTPRSSKWFFIEAISLCLIIYKVNKLFIVAVKHNNGIF